MLLIIQQCVQVFFCMKFYTTIRYTFYLYVNDTTVLFQLKQPAFLSIPSIAFPDCWWLVAMKRSGLLVMKWECRLGGGQSYLLQMLEVTTIRSHAGRRWSAQWRSPPPCCCVLVAALSRWSPGRLSTHQSSQAAAGVYSRPTLPA